MQIIQRQETLPDAGRIVFPIESEHSVKRSIGHIPAGYAQHGALQNEF